MHKTTFVRLLTLILLLPIATFAPVQTQVAQAASTVIYNLYATDTFIQLADGTLLYNYGFVGGRQGVPLTFQNSMKAAVNPGGNTTIATGAPAPTGGPVTAAETPLLGNAQFPAPLIYAAVGDVVEIRLKNLGVTNKGSPNDPHSIHLHGLDVDAANDGVPETSVGAVPANAVGVAGAGNVLVYMFSPTVPGSYMYHCHQEADIHVQMGMYGALVVYSTADKLDPSSASNNGGPGTGRGELWGWKYDKDVVLLLSEIDTRQHASEQAGFVGGGAAFNPVTYQPQYWLINGLGFPNTIHAAGAPVKGVPPFNWTNWIAAHPGYDPFIIGHINSTSYAGNRGDKILLRTINMGFETQPMHMHGFHGKILGSDQRQWTWAQPGQPNAYGAGTPGIGQEKNTLTIGSGETYEWLLDFGTWTRSVATYPGGPGGTAPLNGDFPGGTQSRYGPPPSLLPTSNTGTNPAIPVPAVPGATYIPGPTVTGAIIQQTPGQLFPFHNHDDYKATNNGVYPGGMFTMIMTVD
jgi:FtsP/CotA-like multicopper oxidase with cupredoxin domain